ncbi:MAG: sulfite exporter TauE/SafE family protein [Candidatus Omnitrophica bacterium]|nr:sulfite exporter TauE/SafE family protein [Candidatus Omnitrophota bacterium]
MESGGAWFLFLACAFAAETIGTMAGFGAATILTPIAFLFMDAKTAIAVVASFHLFGNGSRLIFFGRSIHWKTWLQFGLSGILFSFVGAGVTTRLSSSAVEVCFGVFLLLYVGLSTVASERVRLPSHPATLVGGGMVSGFIAGLLGTGGAVRSVCLLAFGLPKEAYVGTSAAIALVVDATRLPVYLAGRFIPSTMIPVLVGLVLVAFAGSWLGQRLVRRISAVGFRRFVNVMLCSNKFREAKFVEGR